MSKTSTPDPLFDGLNDDETDELSELLSLLKENKKDFVEVFNHLNRLKYDAKDETVNIILNFAREYRKKAMLKESTSIQN
jgi:uncharacterized protein YdiU (UPF0061 family)